MVSIKFDGKEGNKAFNKPNHSLRHLVPIKLYPTLINIAPAKEVKKSQLHAHYISLGSSTQPLATSFQQGAIITFQKQIFFEGVPLHK